MCEEQNKEQMIEEFERFCKKNGQKSVYYRIDEQSLFIFKPLNKQKLFMGQEAIMHTETFKQEGKDRKTLRNGLNSLAKKGYTAEILYRPQNEEILNEIESISDEWLQEFDKQEMVFSQGMFDRSEIQGQDLIVIKDETGKIEAFLNIIPDFAPQECTYDLIRKTVKAPNGSMDAMIVKLDKYLIYGSDFDLLQIPAALRKITKPK